MFDVFYLKFPTGLFSHERPVDSIEQAVELSRTRYLWVVDGRNDYSSFDWTWEPVPWEASHTHVWPSQHQQNGGTYLVPKSGMADVNRNHSAVPRKGSVPIIGIDHGNGLQIECDLTTRYISDYLGTLRRVLKKVTDEYVWIVSSVCDYSDFDFTWHPGEWHLDMLHVFASEDQKFGDTFYVHVPSFLQKSQDIKILEWFETLHFVEGVSVPRLPMPVIKHSYDSHVDAIKQHDFQTPLSLFSTGGDFDYQPTVALWQEKTKTVVPLTKGASIIVVPRECKNYINKQVYDYPYINNNHNTGTDPLLDIVFISNGEPNADQHWQDLIYALQRGHANRVVRVDGVNGRVAAYHAAANASRTPWFFAVFAKIKVSHQFDWSWQPDRLQEPKHYIFHAHNPVNKLTYGHQAIIAYNRQLTLGNPGVGLDFTLDSAHEVVPIVSGTAYYANSPWMAWRTAFREVLKLCCNSDVESQYRLSQWLKENNSDDYVKWSHLGAQDAVEYYHNVSGEPEQLKKSYDWAWLASYALLKRKLLPD